MEDQKVTPIDIDRLKRSIAGPATINGVRHDVRQPTGRVIQKVRTATRETGTERLYEAVEACVPSLTADEVLDLTVDQVTGLWAIACGGIEAAKAMFPNVYGPEADQISPA